MKSSKKLVLIWFLSHLVIVFIQSSQSSIDELIIGIDFGSAYLSVGIFRNGKVEIIPNEYGNRSTPSIVAFTDNGTLVGEVAKMQRALNPQRTITSIKRLLGKDFNNEEVQRLKQKVPYEIVDYDGLPVIKVIINNSIKLFSPEEITDILLTKMKQIAEEYLGQKVLKAIITVPADFDYAQRKATKRAANNSGLKLLRMENEPTAAVMAYELYKKRITR